MKVHKITNPLAVGHIAPLVQKFYNRCKETSGLYQSMTYESIYSAFTRIVQFGGEMAELWVSMDGDQIVGFASWKVMDLPHIGTVYCETMYNDTRNQKSVIKLYEHFIEFGKKHRALIYKFDAINDKVAERATHVFDKLEYNFIDSGAKHFIGRKK
jgi:hypothetical protein